VQAFHADHPDVLTLRVVQDGGGLLNYTHAEMIFDHLLHPEPAALP